MQQDIPEEDNAVEEQSSWKPRAETKAIFFSF